MKIDIYKRRFAIANKTGGLSGPAIRPVAVRMVYEASHAAKIPVIVAEDAIEFMMAGARAVAVGMYNFHDHAAMIRIIGEMESFCRETGIRDINEIIGCA